MRRRNAFSALRWVSLLFIFGAVVLTIFQLITYSRIRGYYPPGLVVAGVPIGGMDRQQAAQRILQAYAYPVEVRYGDAVIQIKPATIGFELDLEGMLSAADMQRVNQPFWQSFWNQLWNRASTPPEVPLLSTITEDRLRAYLKDEISARYDHPPTAAVPLPGSVSFGSGLPGTALNIDRAVILIEDALRSPVSRVVNLSFDNTSAPRPSFQNLQILLKQIIQVSGFEGIAELYLLDLQTNQEIHFAYQSGETQMPALDIAFSAESTIKIPIMVSVYRRVQLPLPEDISNWLEMMIDHSENPPADSLMESVMEAGRGPLDVTQDMQDIGLENTILGAYMSKPLFISKIQTPANQRKDINTDPDAYNQTTVADLGMLLDDIYQCAQYSGGTLVAAYHGAITQDECQQMVTLLSQNKIGVLFQGGLPEGTQFAHKHAWANANDGLLHTIGDAGIAFTPGGNFVVSAFMYNSSQLLFDPVSQLFMQLAQAIYNYYNFSSP